MSLKIKSVVALALSAAMLFPLLLAAPPMRPIPAIRRIRRTLPPVTMSAPLKKMTSWPSWFRPAIW